MVYDAIIVGVGMAGSFACYKLAKENKNMKILAIDIGRSFQKRRSQMIGFLGLLPFSDGKLYMNDLNKINDLVGVRKTKSNLNFVNKTLANVNTFKLVEDRSPFVSLEKKLAKNNFEFYLNNFIQMYPKDVHTLSKHFSNTYETNSNLEFSFDNEVHDITKEKNTFVVTTDEGEFKSKKLVLAGGRAGWRWTTEIFKKFGIIDNNNVARYGVRCEANALLFKEFNKSNCTLKKEDLEIGPLCWNGTVIPEDHVDMAIASFRSNENRWKTDKVSFNFIKSIPFENGGVEEADRLAKLTFVLTNDRILKEKASLVINNKSTLSIMKEYNWLKESFLDMNNIIPEFTNKTYIHIPTIMPFAPQIKIGNNLETEVENMYVVGESAGISGLLGAAVSGSIVASEISK